VASVFPLYVPAYGFHTFPNFLFFMVFCDSSPVTAERHGSPELALIPRSAYRQRLFLCGPASFSSSTAYPGYPAHHRRTHVELDIIDGRGNQPFSRKGMHYEHLMPPLFFLFSMLLGEHSTRSRFSGFRCRRLVFQFLFLYLPKSDSFP